MIAPVRLAVFGIGLIGQRHVALINDSNRCTLVACADPDARFETVAAHAGATFYTDPDTLLASETLDGAIIATPNSTHLEVAERCVAHGVGMLVEKPIADTVESGRRIVALAEQAGVALAVGHHRRFDPSIEQARALLDSGDLGVLHAIQLIWALRKHDDYFDTAWRTQRPGGGPVLINLIHDIDLMRYLAGDISRVYAEMSHDARATEVEDVVAATVRFASGALGTIVGSDATPSPWGWEQGSGENPNVPATERNCYRLLCSNGALALPRLELWKNEACGPGSWLEPLAVAPQSLAPRCALARQLEDFCNALTTGTLPRTTGPDGLATLAATLALITSAREGRVVEPSL
jgi:predicted dehydrogenase